MPPTRTRTVDDAGKPDPSRERPPNGSRAKKPAFNLPAAPAVAGSSKDSASVASGATALSGVNAGPLGMPWPDVATPFLTRYRTLHRLDLPSAFANRLNEAVLTAPGIGRHSPTMARSREKRKVGRAQLAMELRRHFNNAAVDEKEVVGEFVYVVGCREVPEEVQAGGEEVRGHADEWDAALRRTGDLAKRGYGDPGVPAPAVDIDMSPSEGGCGVSEQAGRNPWGIDQAEVSAGKYMRKSRIRRTASEKVEGVHTVRSADVEKQILETA